MKIIAQQENLKRALAQVSRVVPGKPVLPILGNVLIAAEGDKVRLTATDLSVCITVWLGAQVEAEGVALVPAGLIADVVGGLPNDKVTLELNPKNQVVNVSCARFSTQLNSTVADEYPTVTLRPPADAPRITLAAPALREAIPQVACAAADSDTRPVLAGVFLRLHGESALLAAADGFRLATKTIALPEPAARQEVIIPAPALRELVGLLDGVDTISLSLVSANGGAPTQALFSSAQFTVATRLIEGQYPDVERILPKGCTTRAVLDVRELSRAVKLAGLIASVSQNVVKLSLTAGENAQVGTLQLSANAAGVGANTGAVEGQVAGEGGQIALNVKYLSEALNVIGTPQVAFEMVTAQAPGVLRPVGQAGYVHLIMPMALR